MRAFAAGFGAKAEDLLDPLPPLSGQAQLAIDCWVWCDGWAPERWPAFDAFHDVDDWYALVELMRVIRKQVNTPAPDGPMDEAPLPPLPPLQPPP